MFVQVRDNARAFASENLRRHYPQLDERQVKQLAAFVMSAADGLFIASEAAGDQIDLVAQFDLIASAVDALVAQFAAAHEARAED